MVLVRFKKMKDLILATEIRQKYNKMDLEDAVKEFEEYTGQEVSQKAIKAFEFCGLNNFDIFTSSFLNDYGLKTLLQL